MFTIIPSILTNNPEEVSGVIKSLNDVILPHGFPLDRVQIDINDGSFLGVKTIEPLLLYDIETDLDIDFHLMTKEPATWVEDCVRGQADRIIGQIEKMGDQISFVGKVSEVGAKVGLAVDIETPLDQLDESIMTSLDVILLMSYPAGYGGQKFDEKVLEKIQCLKEMREIDAKPFKICVDGGIDFDNIKKVKMAGADEVTVGKRLIGGDIEANFEKFIKALY
jgi:ribulose-phosphate 3-epimerase